MTGVRRAFTAVGAVFLVLAGPVRTQSALAQAAATSAPAAARQIGTIDAISGSALTLTTDKGEKVAVTLGSETKVVQLAAGSTDLKTAQPGAVSDLSVGDRVLVLGSPGDSASALTARRLVLMKSTDIAKRHEAEQSGWQHGSGGIVSSVDAASGSVVIKSGTHDVTVATGPSTIIRRYAPGSARFEDATKSTLAELHPGDQLRVRGTRGSDGSIKAEEIVSGSFRHLSGVVQGINVAAGQLTVKDSKTQKPTVLSISSGTAIHQLPPELAARFAARLKAGASSRAASAATPSAATPHAPSSGESAAADSATGHGNSGDLSQVVSRLPAVPFSDLKPGDTVMVVGGDGSTGSITAITILSGVEAILAASPSGGAEMALSPWSMGGGGEAAGASQ